MNAQVPWSVLTWGLLIGTPFLVSMGQVLFKIVGMRWTAERNVLHLAVDPYFILSLAVYAAATVSWILVLRQVPLGLAYTFTALGFVLVPGFSMLLFGEELGLRYVLGLAFIIAGLLIIHG